MVNEMLMEDGFTRKNEENVDKWQKLRAER